MTTISIAVIVLTLLLAVSVTAIILLWPYLLQWIVLWFADRDWFLTTVKEPQAKVIMRYDGIHRCIMAYKDHILARKGQVYKVDVKIPKSSNPNELEDIEILATVGGQDYVTWVEGSADSPEPKSKKCRLDEWDVLPVDWFQKANGGLPPLEDADLQERFQGGVRWLGLPGVNKVLRYNFTWTSLEQKKEDKATGKIRTVFVTKEFTADNPDPEKGPIDYVPLFIDTYVAQQEKADSQDGIPFDVQYLITARVVNPYKATIVAHRWLETVQNQLGGKIADFVRDHRYEDLLDQPKKDGEPLDTKIARELITLLSDDKHLDEFEENLGVKVDKIQIWDISPSDSEFIKIITKRFEAEQQGKADVIEAGYYQQARALKQTADEAYNKAVYTAIREAGGIPIEVAKELGKVRGVVSLGGQAAGILVQAPQLTNEPEKKEDEKE